MKKCKYCKKEFQPRSNRQIVCGDKKCKNKLNAEKMKRYRHTDNYKQRQSKTKIQHQESIILNNVGENYVSFNDLFDGKTNIERIIARSQIKDLMKEKKLNQSFDKYHKSYKMKYSLFTKIYYIDGYNIELPAYPNINSSFIEFIKASGLEINESNSIIGSENLKKRIKTCRIAYASIWSEQLAIKLYNQFILARNKGLKQFDSAIGFFLHYYENLARCLLTPNGYENWKVPSFTDNITVEYIKLSYKKWLEKEKNEEKNQPIITKEIVTDLLKQIHNNLNQQVEAIPIDKNNKDWVEDLKLLLADLIQFSNDDRICERIYYAISKTIEEHGEPFLPIKQSKTLQRKKRIN